MDEGAPGDPTSTQAPCENGPLQAPPLLPVKPATHAHCVSHADAMEAVVLLLGQLVQATLLCVGLYEPKEHAAHELGSVPP